MGAAEDALHQREIGRAKTGTVWLTDFDRGVMDTLAGVDRVANDDPTLGPTGIFIPKLDGACPPDGYPGIQVIFAYPEDVNTNLKTPYYEIRRDDFSPAMDRWHPGQQQYKAPADGANLVTANLGTQVLTGYDRQETLAQAEPYDIVYTISAKGRFRGPGQRNNLDALFKHMLRQFPAYGKVNVIDSIGDLRTYEAFNEGIANIDGAAEVQDRLLGFALTLRVEAELDLKDPQVGPTVRKLRRNLLPF